MAYKLISLLYTLLLLINAAFLHAATTTDEGSIAQVLPRTDDYNFSRDRPVCILRPWLGSKNRLTQILIRFQQPSRLCTKEFAQEIGEYCKQMALKAKKGNPEYKPIIEVRTHTGNGDWCLVSIDVQNPECAQEALTCASNGELDILYMS